MYTVYNKGKYLYIHIVYVHMHTHDGMLAHYYHNRLGVLVLVSKVKEKAEAAYWGTVVLAKSGVCV